MPGPGPLSWHPVPRYAATQLQRELGAALQAPPRRAAGGMALQGAGPGRLRL